jgi:IclR family transcriptional regulator, KDG regulon repressor
LTDEKSTPYNNDVLHNINISSNIDTKSYAPATTVIKAFRLLEYIGYSQPVQPSDMVRALGLTRANVYRLLTTLMKIGYVVREESGYMLTFKLFKLGSTVPLSRNLRDVAKPAMTELMKRAGENIYLTVLCEDTVIAIEEVKSSNHLTLNPDVTYTYPLNSCASGKLFLSAMCEEERQKMLGSLDFEKRTGRTLITAKSLLEASERAAEIGYAMELQEFSDDLNSMASPILDYRGRMVAGIAISGPSMRLTEERLLSLAEPLKATAKRISEELGKGN